MQTLENIFAEANRESYEKPVCRVSRFTVESQLMASGGGGNQSRADEGGGGGVNAGESDPWN